MFLQHYFGDGAAGLSILCGDERAKRLRTYY